MLSTRDTLPVQRDKQVESKRTGKDIMQVINQRELDWLSKSQTKYVFIPHKTAEYTCFSSVDGTFSSIQLGDKTNLIKFKI